MISIDKIKEKLKGDGTHLVHSSIHKLKSGYRIFKITNHQKEMITLVIELETKGGQVSIYIDTNTDKHENYPNAHTQTFEYRLAKGEKYKITMMSCNHVGRWKIYTKKFEHEEK